MLKFGRSGLAALMFAAACMATGVAAAGQKADNGSYTTDARSTASDAEVGVARRAYRAACVQRNSTGYCECMTGALAQELAPHELAIATAALRNTRVQASPEERAHVEAVRADYDRACASFR